VFAILLWMDVSLVTKTKHADNMIKKWYKKVINAKMKALLNNSLLNQEMVILFKTQV